jgi:gamma-glutamyl:cysteine ligase YbdK (ATP-grasp superfamily)
MMPAYPLPEIADWMKRLGERFSSGFSATRPALRTVGRESEYPVVNPDGTAADVSELWPLLGGAGFETHHEGTLVTAVDGPRFGYCAEVGRGTIELIVGPSEDLHGIAALHREGLDRLQEAAARRGFLVLGYGIQPLTPATPTFMAPKKRYGVLLESIGQPWLWFTLTASDQVHACVGRDEIVPLTNIGNAMAPVTVALCGNSPIFEGRDQGVCSSREHQMGQIHSGTWRHGMPGAPDADLSAMMYRLARQDLLMVRRDDENLIPPRQSFIEHLATLGGPDAPIAWTDFLLHEHYIWNAARPRSAHGTIEMRSACQQPIPETMAAAALGFALVEAGFEISRYIHESMGDEAWAQLHAWHGRAVRDGLAAEEPTPGLLEGILRRCIDGLVARGRGEEVYLEPLMGRLSRRSNPAQDARRAFAEGGMPALIALTSRT